MYLQPFSWMILVFVGLFLLVLAYVLFSSISKKASGEKLKETGKRGDPGVCPVCGYILKRGEQVKSALYPGDDDRLCYIYGCPHCYPLCEAGLQRKCPVCNEKMGQEAHLIARYFERRNDKKRIHILGCANCRFKN
ncbi:OadG family protein [Treponema pedis]|uniref:Uncharacterized protein n=1 Tax=Treponema pedis str. T A4 TaxID=1291379 RepID=S6A858_9SPIR|nr:OadG family protein [Treponema pedis]AGT43254.1 hypothetical protein TPE_0758 [Treponema pedis str. T A4]